MNGEPDRSMATGAGVVDRLGGGGRNFHTDREVTAELEVLAPGMRVEFGGVIDLRPQPELPGAAL
ncbi:hypothetical protein ACFU7Y_23200 [Kitasatospora sp. NPDC057542]|uniref:hypothetical protein n=1 Tax=Kitasatospora sp. NPDC057542 TaxID=3346162 RepID=UPI0036C36D8D